MVGDFFRSFGTRFAELVRQMVFAHGDFDFHTAVGIIAQYFDDFRHGRAVLLGISLDFADDDLTGFGFEMRDTVRFQDNTLVQAFVFCFQNRHAAIHIETTDHFALRTFDNIQNCTFAAASAVDTGGADGNNVAVHDAAHLAFV